MTSEFFCRLVMPADSKIVLLVLDGLGGLPQAPGGKTELESACTPNLDALASVSALGLSVPCGPGITVGSGPGHLALFGYDPIEYEIGRGALEALGVDFELGPDDLAARGNFCTIDHNGIVTDRRAGRIPTAAACLLAERLGGIRQEGVEFYVRPVKEHRFAFVMRGPGLGDALSDTDPLRVGVPTAPARALKADSEESARRVNEFIAQAGRLLANDYPANMITLRGFSKFPHLPTLRELYQLNAAAIAVNGMYRGVARLAGMQLLEIHGDGMAAEFDCLEKAWPDFEFFYMHIKKTDTCGEAGDFAGKVGAIEEADALVPRLMALDPDVVIVTGDHSSPAVLRSHSWHPVPALVFGKNVRADGVPEFGERACARGSLGLVPATDLLPLALANAGRVAKYGA